MGEKVDSSRPPPMRNMTLDIDAEEEPGLDSLSKTELEQLANELESDEVDSSEQAADTTNQEIEEVTALVTQTAIDNAIDDLKEQSLAESIDSFDKSEQVHSTIITSSSSNDTSNNESISLDNIVIEEQSEELPTDAQTEEVSTTEDQVFEMTEMNTPAELKTPDDLKTPDFAKDHFDIAPIIKRDEPIEPNDEVVEEPDVEELKPEKTFKSRNESGNNNTR